MDTTTHQTDNQDGQERQVALLEEYAAQLDAILERHHMAGPVCAGNISRERSTVSFRAPMVGFTDLERDLAIALGVSKVRLFITIEVRQSDN